MGLRSFSCFSAQGSEMGGEAGRTQKATLFPSGSALHPIMNGVLKNITLGTRLFFMPHNWAVCPRVSSGVSVRSANETTQRCAGVRMTTSLIGCRAASQACEGGGGLYVGCQMKVQGEPGVERPSLTAASWYIKSACPHRGSKAEHSSITTTTTFSPCLLLSKETRGAPAVSSGA